jgi:hypothetical protein
MWYPHWAVIDDRQITATAVNATAISGTSAGAAWIPLNTMRQGPCVLFYGIECVSAANTGSARGIFSYISRDGNPMTASGAACIVSAVSASASGALALNLSATTAIGCWLSATEALSGTMPVVRWWMSCLGGDAIGSGVATTGFTMAAY